jgi:hypothetical protein
VGLAGGCVAAGEIVSSDVHLKNVNSITAKDAKDAKKFNSFIQKYRLIAGGLLN